MIDFESALIFFECDCDGGFVDPRHSDAMCLRCDGRREHAFYLGTLLANLAIAGALALAYQLGDARRAKYRDPRWGVWTSNVEGWAAPGWSKP